MADDLSEHKCTGTVYSYFVASEFVTCKLSRIKLIKLIKHKNLFMEKLILFCFVLRLRVKSFYCRRRFGDKLRVFMQQCVLEQVFVRNSNVSNTKKPNYLREELRY